MTLNEDGTKGMEDLRKHLNVENHLKVGFHIDK